MALSRNPCRYCVAAAVYKKKHLPSFTIECRQCKPRKEHEEYLASNRKFTPGEPITDLQTLLSQEWVIWHDATKHIEMFRSMSVRTVELFIKNGAFRKAVRKENVNGR